MNLKNDGLVLLGAILGGLLGHVLFFWVADQGLYGLAVPGVLVGAVAGLWRTPTKSIPVICGVLAAIAGLLTEWRFAPFAADESLGYFVTHLHQLRPITLVMIVVGTAIGFWIPFRRGQEVQLTPPGKKSD